MQKERKFSRVLMGSTRSCGQKKQPKPENKEKQADPESSEESNQGADTEKETVKVVVQDGNPSKESNEGPPTGKPGVQFQEPKPDVKQIVISPSGNPSPVAEKKVSIAVQVGNENEAPPAAPGNEKSGASSSAGGKKRKRRGIKGITLASTLGAMHLQALDLRTRHKAGVKAMNQLRLHFRIQEMSSGF